MRHRLQAIWLMFFWVFSMFSSSAHAASYGINAAFITRLTCDSYTIALTGGAFAGHSVVYEFTLTPTSGPATTVSGTIPVNGSFDQRVDGSFTLATTGAFNASGVAMLKDSAGNTVNMTAIEFGSSTPLVCPSTPRPMVVIKKYTNGHDGDNVNGVPTAGPGDFAANNTVALVAPGGAILWTYRVTNVGSEPLVNVQVADDRLGGIVCPKSALAVGESMDCSAAGMGASLVLGPPTVVQGCGDNRPTYNNTGTVTAAGQASGTGVSDSNMSHYCNPAPSCDLGLRKTCEVVQAPSTDWATCKGKLQKFSLIWPSGAGTINISGIANDAPGGVVNPGQRVTFSGPFAVNDQVLNITGAMSGQSVFHVSCSDADMDGRTSTNLEQAQLPGKAQDCGKFQGNGKTAVASRINKWLLDGLVDAEGKVLNCSPAPATPTSSCAFQANTPPQCGTGGKTKPGTLTFQYTPGSCATQSNSQAAGKTICTGSIDSTKPVNIAYPGGSVSNLPLGGTFTMARTLTNSVFTLSNSGGTETITIHTSCSQPLIVGDVYFNLTLVAMDGVGVGKQVTYNYDVTNTGIFTASGIAVTDDKLGAVGSIPTLAPGATQRLSKTTLISQTTTNVATATSASCPAPGVKSSATVTVLPAP